MSAFSSSSLYITIELLISPGFHWAVHITDPYGSTMTRHEWAEDISRTSAERYFYNTNPVPSVAATYTPQGRLIFAWFKISGFVYRAGFDWVEEFSQVFPAAGSYPSWSENRKHGMSCRTWVTQVLEVLRENGLLVRDDNAAHLEEVVKKMSGELEGTAGELSRTDGEYIAKIIDI